MGLPANKFCCCDVLGGSAAYFVNNPPPAGACPKSDGGLAGLVAAMANKLGYC